jgi:hypothetical protein
MNELEDVIASSSIRAYNQGARDERERMLRAIREQVAKQEEDAWNFHDTGILIGLKKAELYLKEQKWI